MPYDVGDTATVTLTVSPYDSTTLATLTVVQPDGTPLEDPPLPDAGDTRGTWSAALPLTQPGLYVCTWTTTGTGAGLERDVVAVRPAPDTTPGPPTVPPLILYPS